MNDHNSIANDLEEIKRYLNQKMDDEECYNFERILQQDPFLTEALEGIKPFKFSEIEKDIFGSKHLKSKRKINLKPLFYTFISLLFIGLIVLVIMNVKKPEPKNKEKGQQENIEEKLVFDREWQHQDSIKDTILNSNIDSTSANDDRLKEDIKREFLELEKNMPATTQKQLNTPKEVTTQKKDKTELETNKTQPLSDSNTQSNSVQLTEEPKMETKQPQILATTEDQPISNKTLSAAPIGGNSNYRSYIDNNIKYPDEIVNKTRETVKIKFIVSPTGEIKNFDLIKGPENVAFTNEAIRIIRSGPKWQPALKNGKPVEEEITLKINFKP